MTDIGKIKYDEKKRKNRSKMTRVDGSLKEVTLRLTCAENDLRTKVARAESFLRKGHLVKIAVRLRGRERANPQCAVDLLTSSFVEGALSRAGKRAHGPPKASGAIVSITLAPSSEAMRDAREARRKLVEGRDGL